MLTDVNFNNKKEFIRGIVIICHGFGEHSGSYQELTEELEQADYSCVTFSQRGHGNLPEKKLGVIPGYQSFLDDIKMIAGDVKNKMPGIPIVLFGHSMGGNIAVNYLLKQNQADFTCAVLESPWLGLYRKANLLENNMAKILNRLLPDSPLPKKYTALPSDKITSDEQKQKEIDNDPLCHSRMSWRMFSEISSACIYALNNVPQLFIPVFLAVAKNEEIVNNEDIEKFYKACGDNVIKTEYEFKHAIHKDRKRKIFYQDVIRFLNAHCPAARLA